MVQGRVHVHANGGVFDIGQPLIERDAIVATTLRSGRAFDDEHVPEEIADRLSLADPAPAQHFQPLGRRDVDGDD